MATSLSDPVPSWHVDASHSGSGGGCDTWVEYARALYDIRPTGGRDSFAATGYLLDRLIFVRSIFDQMEVVRSRRHLESEPSDFLTINVFKTEGLTSVIDDLPISKRPNEGVLQVRCLSRIACRSDPVRSRPER